MSDKLDELLNEKFGFTKNLPQNKMPNHANMHDPVTTRNGRGSYTAGGHPMEKYREHVKVMLHALDTGDQAMLENAVDFESLRRLVKKHGLRSTLADSFNSIEANIKSKDFDEAIREWNEAKKEIPWWFLGLVGKNEPYNDGNVKDLKEHEKDALTNLLDVMDKIRDVSGKELRRANSNSPKQSTNTEAKKNLDKVRKDSKIDKMENVTKKPKNEVGK